MTGDWRLTIASSFLCVSVAACASNAPPLAVFVNPPEPSFEQKMEWILRLEDQRVLRDEKRVVAPTPQPAPGQKTPLYTLPPPPPDLIRMLGDSEGRVRRRAALAIGRVGLPEGVQPLLERFASDTEPEVRQMAAFALGLLADPRAKDALITGLSDPSPLVQGSAAEALGLLGDASAAGAIGRMVGQV